MSTPEPDRPGRERRPDASMSLLRELLENPLDGGYRAVAARRQGPRPVPWWQRVLVVVGCVAIGLGSVWAARELRAPASGLLPARTLLVEQIDERTTEGDALSTQNARYQAEIEALEQAGLELVDEDLAAQLERLAVPSGSVGVAGEGLVIELQDSAAARQGAPGSEEERVTDVDLQVVVNALWASGAEAIAINGRRLGSTTAIRRAGEAILVNLDPVVSPYRVQAIGDPNRLQTELTRTPAATHLDVLESTYNISVAMSTEESMRMSALTGVAPRYAEPLGGRGSGVPPSGSDDGPDDGDEGVG